MLALLYICAVNNTVNLTFSEILKRTHKISYLLNPTIRFRKQIMFSLQIFS